MSEKCPSDCSGKEELKLLQEKANLSDVVKEETGHKLASHGGPIGHSVSSPMYYMEVHTSEGMRGLRESEQYQVGREYSQRKRDSTEQYERIKECPGMCEARIQEGPLAGSILRICGIEAVAATQDLQATE